MKLNMYLMIVIATAFACCYGMSLKSELESDSASNQTESILMRLRRQYGYGAGASAAAAMAGPIGYQSNYGAQNEYHGEYYGEYSESDYAYDYYDWICSDKTCTLCDILTSECCDPVTDESCFLPDSCLNNPCLSGGTCISTKTVDDRADFICVCLPGLTGKYCQLASDYQPPATNPYSAAPSSSSYGMNRMPQAQMQIVSQPMTYLSPPQQIVQQPQPAYALPAPQASPQIVQQPSAASQYAQPAPKPQVQAPSSYASSQPQQALLPAQPVQAPAPMPHHYLQQSFRAQPLALVKKFDSSAELGSDESESLLDASSDENVIRLAATKRKRCPDGQIFSTQKQECSQFALKRSANIRK